MSSNDGARGIELVLEGKPRSVGSFEVMRLLPERRRRNVGPFVFLDHMGPVKVAPGQGLDVAPHPHIGLSTVTYLFDGQMVHRDSLGNVQPIEPGAINLMTAGRGIVHSERSPPEAREKGASMHGLQLWLALPLDAENGPPAFHHHPSASLPSWQTDGVDIRLLLGDALGRRAATEPSRARMLDLAMPPGSSFDVPSEIEECAIYVASGELALGDARFGRHNLLVRAASTSLQISATTATKAIVLGGPPLDAPRHIEWNFVSSSRDTIEKAKNDWRARRFASIPGDDIEFIPLPGEGSTP